MYCTRLGVSCLCLRYSTYGRVATSIVRISIEALGTIIHVLRMVSVRGLTFVLFGVLLEVGTEREEFHHLPLLHHGHGLTAEHVRPRTWHLYTEGTHQISSTCIYVYKRLMNLISSAAQNHKHYGSPCVYKAGWCAR